MLDSTHWSAGWKWAPMLTSAPLAVAPGNTHSFLWLCSDSGNSEFREDGEAPPRSEWEFESGDHQRREGGEAPLRSECKGAVVPYTLSVKASPPLGDL